MSQTIYKYTLPVSDEVAVEMPERAEILHVAEQIGAGLLQVWARVDTEAAPTQRTFSIRGTGHPADGLGQHIATVLTRSGLVWHLFEPPSSREVPGE